ncbi:MAG: DUF1275 domain-containing protein [Treponema sp.]|nr:DUF1275 domain-containing protein [Treponema sp.]
MESAQARREAHIHYTVAFIGGWLGLFPLVNVSHFFGSAQTVNITELITESLGGNWYAVALHALGLFLYAGAVFLATFLPKHTKLNVKLLALLIDALACVAMWQFPTEKNLPLLVYLYPTFFSMPFQWCAFDGAYDYKSSTIFSSNNVRQFVSALTEVFCNGDKSFALKAKFFGATLLGFYLGVTVSWLCWHFFGNAGFLLALVPIGGVVLLLRKTVIK